MIAEMTLFQGAVSKVFENLVSRVASDGMDFSKKEIKDADQNRKSYNQNLQTQIYYVIIDALNEFTHNKYKEQDKLYDAAEIILKEIKSSKNTTEAIKLGLRMFVSGVNDNTCQEFLEILCREICKDENNDLYREMDMIWKKQEGGYIYEKFEKINQSHREINEKMDYISEKMRFKEEHTAEDYSELPVINRAEEYAQKWNENVFLNDFNKWDEHVGVNIKLRDIYLEEQLPHYVWKANTKPSNKLKNLLKKYIIDNNEKKMLLIFGQPGIGKSSLITWIMANLVEKKDDILVYQFANDLGSINWQGENVLNDIFKVIGLERDEIENKTLILDGFDEIYIDGVRNRILNNFYQELEKRHTLKTFSLIITCRENYMYDLQNIKCDYITLQSWDEKQIKNFCKIYEKECKNGNSEIRINRILENKEIFGVPLILYMVLALNISIDEDSSIVDIYDQIFLLDNGGIYDRRYASPHRTSEMKQWIHYISQKIAFWIFENNSEQGFIPQREYEKICDIVVNEMEDNSQNIQRDVLIGNYFALIKHCEGIGTGGIQFIHRSIYEYFVAEYFFESIKKMTSKEEVAGKLGELLKNGHLSKKIVEFIKYKFDNVEYNFPEVILDVFVIMLQDGMTYYAKEKFKNIIEREMNVFTNMLELVYLKNSIPEGFVEKFIFYLYNNKQTMLNLERIELRNANLTGVYLVETNLSGAKLNVSKLNGADLRRTDLRGVDLSRADLSGADLRGANLKGANLIKTKLRGARLNEANLSEASLVLADLKGADLKGADLRRADLSRADLNGAIFDEE